MFDIRLILSPAPDDAFSQIRVIVFTHIHRRRKRLLQIVPSNTHTMCDRGIVRVCHRVLSLVWFEESRVLLDKIHGSVQGRKSHVVALRDDAVTKMVRQIWTRLWDLRPIFYAVLTRVMFFIHGFLSVWLVTHCLGKPIYWLTIGGVVLLFFEMIYTLLARKGQEYK